MQCLKCNTNYPATQNFCSVCGEGLVDPSKCGQCSTVFTNGTDTFCSGCGAKRIGTGVPPTVPLVGEQQQHDFLDDAKSFRWDDVYAKIGASPALVGVQPCHRWTALHQAAFSGNPDPVRFLLDHGAPVNAQGSDGKTPIEAAEKEHIQSILRNHMWEKHIPIAEQNAFLDFAKAYNWPEVRRQISINPGLVGVQPLKRNSALHQAAESGNSVEVKFLLDQKAPIDALTKDDRTPLHLAQNLAVSQLLQPVCTTLGCGKPTWNGLYDDKCGSDCPPTLGGCTILGCGQPVLTGQAQCAVHVNRCSCGMPTWDGFPGQCLTHLLMVPAPLVFPVVPAPFVAPTAGPTCTGGLAGCTNPTWNGMPGQKCRKGCGLTPVVGLSPSGVSCTKLNSSDKVFQNVEHQFKTSWGVQKGLFSSPPVISEIWTIVNPKLITDHNNYCLKLGDILPVFGHGANPGNKQRRFHGTSIACNFKGTPCGKTSPLLCKACSIIEGGQKTGYAAKQVTDCCKSKSDFKTKGGNFFGKGIYVTSSSSAACRYARPFEFGNKTISGVVVMLGVACGKAEIIDGKNLKDNPPTLSLYDSGAGLYDQPLPGCNSRIIQTPHDSQIYIDHANANGEPLLKCENEIVVFDDAASVPKYLIVFKTTRAVTK